MTELQSNTPVPFDLSSLKNKTHVMGILNVTPDSFSDGGLHNTLDKAVEHAVRMESGGADIIDIGGESTRPGHDPVSVSKEIDRVVPIIEAVKQHVNVPISVDTYKAETAQKAIEAGAAMINDQWGAKGDPDMGAVAANMNVPIILMHNRTHKEYNDLIHDIKDELQASIDIAIKAGVPREHIILDPGIGFGKTQAHNLIVMNHLDTFTDMGYPVLLGASRKSFIGSVLGKQASDRDIGTGATTSLGITKGVQIVRVHNVKLHVDLAKVMDAMLSETFPSQ